MKFMILILFPMIVSLQTANAATETSGGWNQGCSSRVITCESGGRQIACTATLDSGGEVRSSCTATWGNEGWVRCETFDRRGNVIGSYSDQCP